MWEGIKYQPSKVKAITGIQPIDIKLQQVSFSDIVNFTATYGRKDRIHCII